MHDWLKSLSLPQFEFVWPSMLWLLVIVPAAILIYQLARRYERSNLASVFAGLLVVIGLAAVLTAIARPKLQINLPSRADQLMIVLDISGSMSADDVSPTRLDAAKAKLKDMIAAQPGGTRIGLVTTAATATLIQPPTTEHDALNEALDTITIQTGSALGSGILIGLSELLPSAGIDVQTLMNDSMRQNQADSQPSWRPDPNVTKPPGSNRSQAMVLISDGGSNMGPDIMQMADLASQFGVRIHTIGIGTKEGAVVKAEGVSQRVRLESGVLADIADLTLGTYYESVSSSDLLQIFEAIEASVTFDRRQSMEISALLLLSGVLLLLVGMGAKLWRQGRIL
ncbi:vWA domain-containing protein [Orrella daihaiensis]|uniref:VWA domain-containing protein n=1 Tax=Orrella daihaiensis TaxID=2782176 RepID=A0ABY4AJ30_9BURK|nr:VWA domain-containing protein [Orrella daihaiensis]UOD50293.1 VWA domain-containing protein [Orrella daihaiensis]